MRHITGQRNKTDILKQASGISRRMLENCELCPRRCGVNRLKGQKGNCKALLRPAVYSYFPHFGEEPPISGTHGSGTIFFTHCTLRCVYCQNYEFSQLSDEVEVSTQELAAMMLGLAKKGCHNINLVTPAHYVPQILEALYLASKEGLDIPIVYNTSGYESTKTLKLLDGIVDIYLPDARYGDAGGAKRFSNAPDYVTINQEALREMFRQAGNLVLNKAGIAESGLIIRHLVLPNHASSTETALKFISESLSKEIYISLMSQYHPVYKAKDFPEIDRRLLKAEYEEAVSCLLKYGLSNGWIQDIAPQTNSRLLGINIKRMK